MKTPEGHSRRPWPGPHRRRDLAGPPAGRARQSSARWPFPGVPNRSRDQAGRLCRGLL